MTLFKMFAGTDIGLRENNEDNFTVCPDLTSNEWIVPADYKRAIPLGKNGCIMVVADGMGGQNAGEVASAIAVETVQNMFSPANVPAGVLDKSENIKNYLRKVIVEADARVKSRSKTDSASEGMGSTIVIAWVIGEKAYIAWLGDSRAYSFIKGKGIARISKDHSYVQQLVDAGALSDEEAMHHPNSNVITRSLGDFSQKAKPEVVEHSLEDKEVILLCSDGLCGVCRDDEIGGIIEEECQDLQICRNKLTTSAITAGGSDNITIALLHVFIDGQQENVVDEQKEQSKSYKQWFSLSNIMFFVVAIFLFAGFCFAGLSLFLENNNLSAEDKNSISKRDSLHVTIKIDVDTLKKMNDPVKFHVSVSDDSSKVKFVYPENIINLDYRNRTLRMKKFPERDTTIYIKVVCISDPTKSDSAKLVLINNKIGSDMMMKAVKEMGKNKKTETTAPADSADSADSATESKGGHRSLAPTLR